MRLNTLIPATMALTASNALAQTTTESGPNFAPTFPPVIADPGTLPVGATCSSSAQCAGGADCYAVNSMLIPVVRAPLLFHSPIHYLHLQLHGMLMAVNSAVISNLNAQPTLNAHSMPAMVDSVTGP